MLLAVETEQSSLSYFESHNVVNRLWQNVNCQRIFARSYTTFNIKIETEWAMHGRHGRIRGPEVLGTDLRVNAENIF
jgi:hypothetical protein